MNLAQTFARNVFFKGLGEIFIRLVSFAFVVLVARSLGGSDFGVLNFAYSFALLFVVVIDFGLNPLLVRDAAREPARLPHIFYNFLIVKTVLALLFGVAVLVGLSIVAPEPAMRRAAYWLAAFVMLNSFTEFCNTVFHARQQMQFEAAVMVFQKLALLGFGLLALGLGWGLYGVAGAYVAAGGCGLAIALGILIHAGFIKGSWKPDFGFLKYIWRQALPLTLTTLFVSLYFRIDMTILSKLRPAEELGWYGAAHKCVEVFMVIPAILVIAAFPGFSKLFLEDRRKLAEASVKVIRILMILGIPLAGGMVVLARPLMILIFGPAYAASGYALAWLSIAMCFIFLNYPLSYILICSERQKVNALVSGIAVIVSVGANLFLIPKFGYLGAAVSAVLTEIFLLAAYFLAVSRCLFPLPMLVPLVRVIAATGIMLVPVWFLRSMHPLIAVSTGIIVYLAAVWLMRAIQPEDINLLRRAVKRGADA
ncbi:flippase [bacterium]|nr:flippase [bacterium]